MSSSRVQHLGLCGRQRAVSPLPAHRKLALAIEIVAAYLRVRLILRRDNLPSTLATLRSADSRRPEDLPPERLAAAVERTLQHLPSSAPCLHRSLVLVNV